MKITIFWLVILGSTLSYAKYQRPVTIAILAKDKAHCLPLYLECLEKQSWPSSRTYLYIRTNNNKDTTAQILKEWINKVKNRYLDIYFDDSDLNVDLHQYKPHEWNSIRCKILGKIRQDSLDWAKARDSHYFVVDCDNFIYPFTLEKLLHTKAPLIAPLLRSKDLYSNYHAAIDDHGYYKDSSYYLPLLNQEIKGLIQVPVIHCTYLIRHEYIAELRYDDESYRYEYVIFSDSARKKNIPQYLDTRYTYGYLTFTEEKNTLENEPWYSTFLSELKR